MKTETDYYCLKIRGEIDNSNIMGRFCISSDKKFGYKISYGAVEDAFLLTRNIVMRSSMLNIPEDIEGIIKILSKSGKK